MAKSTRRHGRWMALVGTLAVIILTAPVAQTQGPVKIGFIHTDSGPFAQPGADMRDGFLLYWGEIGNRAGGRAVEILTEGNATNKVDEGLTKARKLVERDNVHILAGVIETPIAYAIAPYVTERKVPFLITNAGGDEVTQRRASPYVFRANFSNSDSSHPLGEWAYKQGYREMVLMAMDFGAGYEQIGGVARAFIDAGGRVIQEIYSPLGTPDFAPYLTRVRRDAHVVAVFYAGADALRFVRQYAEYGLKGRIPLIGKGFLTEEDILARQAADAVGIVTALHWSAALDTPQNKRFLAAYGAKYKRLPSVYAEQGYVGAQMVAKALDAIKGNIENQQAFLSALAKVEIDAPRGKVKLDSYHNPIHPIHIRKVEARGNEYVNAVIATYPNVNQFWKWNPKEYLLMPSYADMRNQWAK